MRGVSVAVCMLGFFALIMSGGVISFAEPDPPTSAPTTRPSDTFKLVTVVIFLDENDLPSQMIRRDVFFLGNVALINDAVGLPVLVFHLDREAVSDMRGGYSTLSVLREQAEATRTAGLRDVDAMADRVAADELRGTLRPDLRVAEEDGGRLALRNAMVSYEIETQPLAPDRVRHLYMVDRLSALMKSNLQTPPYLNLAVDDELERRGAYATEILLTLKSRGQTVKIQSKARVVPLSASELARFAPLMKGGNDPAP